MQEEVKPALVVAVRQRTPGNYGPLSALAAVAMKIFGWRLVVADPIPDRCVIVMYPHTAIGIFQWDC